MATSTDDDEYSHEYALKYDDLTSLNTYDLHTPTGSDAATSKYWIIYVHGGAWRDPAQTSKTIIPTLSHLSPSKHSIAGVLSLNYRLSSYPEHPRDPSKPDDSARNVVHPSHIEDILTAICCLQRTYGFTSNYILAGHSCGATLAFQTVMGVWKPRKTSDEDEPPSFHQPVAIVGIEGIYSLPLLLSTHFTVPIYQLLIENAFGTDQSQWVAPSPVNAKLHKTWPGTGQVVVLAQSKDDELVDWVQTERMSDALWREKNGGRRDVVLGLHGGHDEIWEEGKEVARSITKALEMLNEK